MILVDSIFPDFHLACEKTGLFSVVKEEKLIRNKVQLNRYQVKKEAIELLPFQLSCFNKTIKLLEVQHGTINISPTGSGKNIIAQKVAEHLNLILFIIHPNSAKSEWNCTYKMTYSKLVGNKNKFNHDFLEEVNGEVRVTEKFTELCKRGIYLVFDEAQNASNKNSLTYKYSKLLLDEVLRSYHSRFQLLSATIVDRPEHIINFCRFIGLINFPNKPYSLLNAALHICKSLNLNYDGFSVNTYPEMYQMLFHYYLSLRWTVKTDPVKLDYNLTINNCFFKINRHDDLLLKKALHDLDTYSEGSTLVHLSRKRLALQLIEECKLNDMKRITLKLLEEKVKMMVVLNYKRNLIKFNNMMLDVPFINATFATDRELSLHNFIHNPEIRLLITTLGPICEGWNGHDQTGEFPRKMLISPGIKFKKSVQCTGRLKRIGVKSDSHVYFFYSDNPYELELMTKLNSRSSSMASVSSNMVLPTDYNIIREDQLNIIGNKVNDIHYLSVKEPETYVRINYKIDLVKEVMMKKTPITREVVKKEAERLNLNINLDKWKKSIKHIRSESNDEPLYLANQPVKFSNKRFKRLPLIKESKKSIKESDLDMKINCLVSNIDNPDSDQILTCLTKKKIINMDAVEVLRCFKRDRFEGSLEVSSMVNKKLRRFFLLNGVRYVSNTIDTMYGPAREVYLLGMKVNGPSYYDIPCLPQVQVKEITDEKIRGFLTDLGYVTISETVVCCFKGDSIRSDDFLFGESKEAPYVSIYFDNLMIDYDYKTIDKTMNFILNKRKQRRFIKERHIITTRTYSSTYIE